MATNSLTSDGVARWLEAASAAFDQNKDRLTELDSAIGDGDHGANMARGFQAVKGKLPELAGKEIGMVFKTVAMTLISTVGGASGPLYGTFFLQAAAPAKGKTELSAADLAAAFEAGLVGIVNLGKAAVGDKTMIDVLTPATQALSASAGGGLEAALSKALEAARKGAESTVPLVAKKGRASYLGERSAGHLDPGAASSVILFETLASAAGI